MLKPTGLKMFIDPEMIPTYSTHSIPDDPAILQLPMIKPTVQQHHVPEDRDPDFAPTTPDALEERDLTSPPTGRRSERLQNQFPVWYTD
jgi:hypothetical protein